MNRIYLTLPLTVVLLFFGYYMLIVERNYRAEQAQLEAERTAALEAEELERRQREQEALAEARRLAEEEAESEAERRARKIAEQEKEEQELRAALAEATKRAADAAQRRAELEGELEQVQTERIAVQNSVFDLERDVELLQIERRNADREIQRILSIVALEIAESSVLTLPELPSPQPPP